MFVVETFQKHFCKKNLKDLLFECFVIMYVCIYVPSTLKSSEEGVRCLRTGVTDGCEPPYRYLELKLGSLQEHEVLLDNEPSLQL